MSFLSVQNTYLKSPHNNNSFLLSEPRGNFIENRKPPITENNNEIKANGQEKSLQEVWSKHKFEMDKVKAEPVIKFSNVKMTWAEEKPCEKVEEPVESKMEVVEEPALKNELVEVQVDKEESPAHHARRPPNAFLIFCKKHRPIVRERYPSLENRGVTKILGEWWALLHNGEKLPYNDLAKEYKDAFLSANPNFRWYKLPAPPLRTLTPRPPVATKAAPPLSSPSNPSEFTPGKLADESQLGGLTSLMNNNFTTIPKTECCTTESSLDNNNHKVNDTVNHYPKNEVENMFKASNENLERYDGTFVSPLGNIQPSTPPKPIKKRFFDYYLQNKACARNILPEIGENDESGLLGEENESGNMTKQDLVNKVVDDMFAKQPDDSLDKNGSKEVRKSERMCKGKRYEMFMSESRLLGTKRDSKPIQTKPSKIESKIETELNSLNNNIKPETPKLDLGNTIKRLAERTNVKLDFENQTEDTEPPITNQRARSISETSEGSGNKSSPPNFNLDLRISNLPCLSYDDFVQRKRDSKKRKIRIKTDAESKHKVQKLDNRVETQPVGSKKRKNKQSITHLGKKEVGMNSDLLGLATLAEVAANTEKINEQISE